MSLSDKEYYQLTVSISKAVSGVEMPLKVKHARAAIIGTFHNRGAHAFWAVALRQPLQENRITAWKFCHLLHKVLREGHVLCLQHSMRHRAMLEELGKLWGHLNDGYGLCIRHYAKLLITKLEFHDRNPRFPGSLQLKRGELDAISGNDSNFYFQLAVEMFDYLDEVIALQATIFNAITTFHVNSMTSAGQCRLAPLIPLIQDSNQLYDFLARIMFKLHSTLPNDVLGGHRDRFRTIFTQLKAFYNQSRNLQYFVSLISVPKLPDNAPNFSSQVDFGAYIPPVVVVPEPDPEPENEVVETLVDMSIPPQRQLEREEPVKEAPAPNEFESIIRDRDDLIMHLQSEVERLGKYVKSVSIEYRDDHARLEEQVAHLNAKLSEAQEELTNHRFIKEELELKAQTVEKYQAEEERAKTNEEKFTKLKTLYTQIRDEHVKLLRQHGEVSKQLALCTKTVSDNNKEKDELKVKLDELQDEKEKTIENLTQSMDSREKESTEIMEKLTTLEQEKVDLILKYDDMEANQATNISELNVYIDKVEAELKHLKGEVKQLITDNAKLNENFQTISLEKIEVESKLENKMKEYESLEIKNNELIGQEETLEKNINEGEQLKSELTNRIEEMQHDKESLTHRYEELLAAKADCDEELTNWMQKFEHISNEQVDSQRENEEAIQKIDTLEKSLSETNYQYEVLQQELKENTETKDKVVLELMNKIEEINASHQEELNKEHTLALNQIEKMECSLKDLQLNGEARIRALVETCIQSAETLTTRATSENEITAASQLVPHFMIIADELQDLLDDLGVVHNNYVTENNDIEGLVSKVVLSGHIMAIIHVQGMSICNSSPDIDNGEKISEELKKWNGTVIDLFKKLLVNGEGGLTVDLCIQNVKVGLLKITNMIQCLSNRSDNSEQIADIIEAELLSMDKAIEEAASKIEEMLSLSRKSDSGIKLEVNEKILDACTSLMKCIRILVQKSRMVQAEIVSIGKGTASVQEFYKRNNQWTEGLYSAAKSVAQGANFLVTAANKAVTGETKHQLDIIVAAQEIAACTTQLVVASRVKAPRGSTTLTALGQASRDVTQATGMLVATAKVCNQRLEEVQDLDLTNLSVHQAKTLEMEIQVKVLELEQALQVERLRLAAFRRKNYRDN